MADLDWLGDDDELDHDKLMGELTYNKLSEQHKKSGFREGFDEGKESNMQNGFNHGFQKAAASSFPLSALLVTIRSINESDRPSDDQRKHLTDLETKINAQKRLIQQEWNPPAEGEDSKQESGCGSDSCACKLGNTNPVASTIKPTSQSIQLEDLVSLERELNELLSEIFPVHQEVNLKSANPFL